MKPLHNYKPKHYKGLKKLLDYHIQEYKVLPKGTPERKYTLDTIGFLAREQREQSYDDTTRDMLNKLRTEYIDTKLKEKWDSLYSSF